MTMTDDTTPTPELPEEIWIVRALAAESEVKSLRRTLDTHAELTAQAYREGPQQYLREMLLARKELKACRGFIEAIANGRMQSLSMADARYFLAGLNAETKAKIGDGE